MANNRIGSREEWQAAREELLHGEKEHTRMGDDLARRRRELPWVPVEKDYRFETDEGTRTLPELFDGRSQLIVYHFMFGPSYEAGCPTCSSMGRHRRRCPPAPARARRDDDVRLAGAAGEAAGVQAADGLEHALGPLGGQRLQPRPRLLTHRGGDARGRSRRCSRRERPPILEHNATSSGTDVTGYLTEGQGLSVFALDARHRVPDLCDRGPRRRVPDGLLRDPRPSAEGARRGRFLPALAPATRRVRPRLTRAVVQRGLGAPGRRSAPSPRNMAYG